MFTELSAEHIDTMPKDICGDADQSAALRGQSRPAQANLKQHVPLADETRDLLEPSMDQMNFSARAHDRIST